MILNIIFAEVYLLGKFLEMEHQGQWVYGFVNVIDIAKGTH